MEFAYGATRWVILTERYAIKIARFRPVRPFVKLFESLLQKQVKENLEKHHSNHFLAVIKYLVAGMVANRTEYRLYKKHGSDLLAPTLYSFCWIVNIQRRGEVATESDIKAHYFWKFFSGMTTLLAADMLQQKQYCLIDGKVHLADYGIEGLEPIIANYNEMALTK